MMEFNDIIRNAASLPTTEIAADVNKALTANGCVVLTAPPGAGKSTLLPLTVMAGFLPSDGKILMLEPRRLAARQVAERMADMLSEHTGGSVGYRVRFENRVSESTRIEVITEGILTRMLIADPLLEGVSVVIFDEFHERSINSDLAFALTRQCQQILRPDLKIVIMSATIDTSSICTSLNAPLIECRGKMFPVETRYATTDISPADIPTAVASAINKAHSQHEGDILAFLPGQADIAQCERLLADKLSPTAVFPLYGNLSPEQQRRAVAPSGKGERKIVLATPVAETSITIEGVRIVVDSGYCRQLVYNPRSGLSHLETVRISLDMATQRSGRAGRVAPGVCYRLWTKASEHRMNERRRPEISDADLAPTLLDIAAFGESDAEALPWLTTPQPSAVAQAWKLLTTLGAVDSQNRITSRQADVETAVPSAYFKNDGARRIACAEKSCLRHCRHTGGEGSSDRRHFRRPMPAHQPAPDGAATAQARQMVAHSADCRGISKYDQSHRMQRRYMPGGCRLPCGDGIS